jgi:hypothetical protein
MTARTHRLKSNTDLIPKRSLRKLSCAMDWKSIGIVGYNGDKF